MLQLFGPAGSSCSSAVTRLALRRLSDRSEMHVESTEDAKMTQRITKTGAQRTNIPKTRAQKTSAQKTGAQSDSSVGVSPGRTRGWWPLANSRFPKCIRHNRLHRSAVVNHLIAKGDVLRASTAVSECSLLIREVSPDAAAPVWIDLRRRDHDAAQPKSGWLIARRAPTQVGPPEQAQRERPGSLRFLQLATGQWVPSSCATWFPSPGSAMAYVSDFDAKSRRQTVIVYLG